jgi:hypothetical protein
MEGKVLYREERSGSRERVRKGNIRKGKVWKGRES